MTKKEPSGEALLSARLARAYPALSAYSAARLALELCAIERAQRRHAERCCSGEDGGYIRYVMEPNCDGHLAGNTRHDPEAEARAEKRIERRLLRWNDSVRDLSGCPDDVLSRRQWQFHDSPKVDSQGDPRGAVLLVRLPGEAEAVAV